MGERTLGRAGCARAVGGGGRVGRGERRVAQLAGAGAAARRRSSGCALPAAGAGRLRGGPDRVRAGAGVRGGGDRVHGGGAVEDPAAAGDRVKTDRRDAERLARLLRLGELVAVRVPEPHEEAARDLVRAREDARGDLMRARHRLSKLLLRHGLVYDASAWTHAHDALAAPAAVRARPPALAFEECLRGGDAGERRAATHSTRRSCELAASRRSPRPSAGLSVCAASRR